jgi:hypothetical protein
MEVCDRWKDFTLFVQDVDNIPETSHQFRRLDTSKPWNKDNYYWAAPLGTPEEKRSKLKERQRLARLADPQLSRRKSLKKNYNLTLEEYQAMFDAQNGVCKICGNPESRPKLSLSVDHCHAKGHVRGLLCKGCNTALGLFQDSEELLMKAIEYLKTPDSSTE